MEVEGGPEKDEDGEEPVGDPREAEAEGGQEDEKEESLQKFQSRLQ